MSCIINGLKDEARASTGVSSTVYGWLDEIGIPKGRGRKSKLRNGRIQQLTETLAMFDRMGCRPTSKESIARLSDLRERLDDACADTATKTLSCRISAFSPDSLTKPCEPVTILVHVKAFEAL